MTQAYWHLCEVCILITCLSLETLALNSMITNWRMLFDASKALKKNRITILGLKSVKTCNEFML